MVLNKEAVDKLRAIHEKATGEKLSDEEAWEMATRLFALAAIARRQIIKAKKRGL